MFLRSSLWRLVFWKKGIISEFVDCTLNSFFKSFATPSFYCSKRDCSRAHFFSDVVNVFWTGSMLESKAGNVAQRTSGREWAHCLDATQPSQGDRRAARLAEQALSISCLFCSLNFAFPCCNYSWNSYLENLETLIVLSERSACGPFLKVFSVLLRN
jgi:hypothetical protein